MLKGSKRNYSGLFVSFEGGEGASKTTQIPRLREYLQGVYGEERVIQTREPGGTELGEQVRNILVNGKDMYPEAELLLFNSSRAQFIREIVLPHLRDGHIVLADRAFDSTRAYQGVARGLDMNFIENHLGPFVMNGLIPDMTYLLDIDVEQGLRNANRRGEVNRLDNEVKEFHLKVNQAFRDFALAEPDRFRVVPYVHNGQEAMEAEIRKHFLDLVARTGFK